MASIDIFTCYAMAGVGALIGLGLIGLVHTDQPRIRQAVQLYRAAFLCLSSMLAMSFSPQDWAAPVAQAAIGLVAVGVCLLAWAFRQLNGRRTHPLAGTVACVAVGSVLWAVAAWADATAFVLVIGAVFSLISVLMLVDQGWLILRSPRVTPSELSLLAVAGVFAAIWMATFWHGVTVPGPYPAHWLHAPAWLLPFSGLAFALLPLSVAAVVFAIINDRLRQQLRARALSDDLTGALSRRGLRELGERMLAMQANQANQVAVLMMDLDHFKLVNDRYGHLVGDEVLRHVTRIVRDHLRDDALLARYGGEEFTVLLPIRGKGEARVAAERIRQLVASSPCPSKQGPVPVTVSIGVSFHNGGESLETDLSRADQCLYIAKRAGRNRVVFDDATRAPAMPSEVLNSQPGA